MSRAVYEVKSAPLASEFGESYARRLLGDEAVDNMPRYVRGVKKGRPKGRLVWRKCVKGGWVGQGSVPDGGGAVGYVESRTNRTVDAAIVYGEWSEPEQAFAVYSAPYFAHGKEFPVQSSPDWWRYS